MNDFSVRRFPGVVQHIQPVDTDRKYALWYPLMDANIGYHGRTSIIDLSVAA